MANPPGVEFECHRCGRRIAAARVDVEGWLIRHAWDDGKSVAVCPSCQTSDEAALVVAVKVDSSGA